MCILVAQHKPAVSFLTPTRSQLQVRVLFFTRGRNALRKVPGTELSASSATGPNIKSSKQDEEKFDMPWSETQEWTLKNSLAKFTVIIPTGIDGKPTRRYAMWRTLAREVPELAGYPIPFLEEMHQRLVKKDSSNPSQETPGVLPMVDNYEFTPDGGIAGLAYGLPGIADGTRIHTPSLISPEKSVPLGYVTTQGELNSNDFFFSYELGTCASLFTYSSDAMGKSAVLAVARRSVVEGAVDSSRQAANIAKDIAISGSGLRFDTEANKGLVYFSGATTVLLASATAVGMLSHHLTVNMFWV